MTRAKNLYLLLAQEVKLDAEDNMTSIIKIIEKFSAKVDSGSSAGPDAKPGETVVGIPIHYCLVSSWLFDKQLSKDTLVTVKITMTDPGGKSLSSAEQEHLVPTGTDKINFNFNAHDLAATTSGQYLLQAELLSASKKLLAEAQYPYKVELEWKASRVLKRG